MTALKISQGAQYSAILGFGGYRPRRVVDNAEIVTMIDSSDDWIRTRSGIIERRWAEPDETVQMMSVSAARKALERSGVEPAQLDTVIVSTVTDGSRTGSRRGPTKSCTRGAAADPITRPNRRLETARASSTMR